MEFDIKERENLYSVEVLKGDNLHNRHIFADEITIVMCRKGYTCVNVDNAQYQFREGCNFIVRDTSHISFTQSSEDCEVVTCRFTKDFFGFIFLVIEKDVFDVLFEYYNPELIALEDFTPSSTTVEKLVALHDREDFFSRKHYTSSLTFSYVLERYDAIISSLGYTPESKDRHLNPIFLKFRDLCETIHTQERNADIYAERLGVSSRHLYTVVKRSTNMSPKKFISEQVIKSAKRLLLTTMLTVQEISKELNFSDQSNFAQYFKDGAGMSPLRFRATHNK